MSLSYEGRKKKILDQLAKEEKIQIPAMAEVLNVSAETIRRDLGRLDKEGKLRKVYGGAVKQESPEPPFEQKTLINAAEKQDISRLAATLVEDGDIIMIGSGTTTVGMIPYLSTKKNVTIISHSAAVMRLAMEQFPGRIIFIGGELNVKQQSVNGPLAEWMLNQLKADKAFFAAGGISMTDGISDYTLSDANLSRKMMDRAGETIVLADHTKFGKTTFARICPLKNIDILISDRGCPEEWIQMLASKETTLLIAEEEEQL